MSIDIISLIKAQMEDYFKKYLASRQKAIGVHIYRAVNRRFHGLWSDIFNYEVCLVCFRGDPQYPLPCGHCICKNCVAGFGICVTSDPHLFTIENCILCGRETNNLKIRIHPPTSGPSVLSINGGGGRAVVPLAILKMMQDRIDLPIPLLRIFQIVIGTSSGKFLAIPRHYLGS
jgi:hypothetical protein